MQYRDDARVSSDGGHRSDDRTGLNECAALAYDRKELAAMRHK